MAASFKLSALLRELLVLPAEMDREVQHLTLDSRTIGAGSLFFACQGSHQDGRHFIEDALEKGATAIVAEVSTDNEKPILKNNIPIIFVKNLKDHVSEIAAIFYGHPARALRIVGITGTNGKTSCSHFIAGALHVLGIPCGVMGTIGNGLYGEIKPATLTTPDPITVQALFAEFVAKGAKVVAMEVSSHSLDQGRVKSVPFEVGIFTNLTRDHLDYHGDMVSYGAAKRRLFDNPLLKNAVINLDDAFGKTLAETLPEKVVYGYSLHAVQSNSPTISASQTHITSLGLAAEVDSPWGQGLLQTRLVGHFNLSNMLAVFAALNLLGIPCEDALNSLGKLQPVAGRMQALGGEALPLVVIDYAHTPDALEKVLSALKQHSKGKLHCLFGCGGDRDKGKRPMMAKIAEKYADFVMVTDDNPRHETPEQIIQDIMVGFSHPDRIIIQHDRSKAIQEIIQCAKPGDCVLIAGKGAETYQQIGDTKIPFSDIEKAQASLEEGR